MGNMRSDNEILRGRKAIASFIGISLRKLDALIDRNVFPVWRIGDQEGTGIIVTTRSLVLDAIERQAKAKK